MRERAGELARRGYTIFPSLLSTAATSALHDALRAQRHALGMPPLYAEEDLLVAPDVNVSPVGLTFFGLLGRVPQAAELLLEPEILALLEEVLGTGFELEQVSAVLSDHTRPFFFWHNHVGGIDGADHRGRYGPGPAVANRLVCTLYAVPLDEAHGTMLVQPRALGATTAPPHEPGRTPWPSAVALRAEAGSVVVLDEACWHAVTPMGKPGERAFAAFFVRRAGVGPTVRVDPEIARARERNAALARAYRASDPRHGAKGPGEP